MHAFNSLSVSSTGLNATETRGLTNAGLKCCGAIDKICLIIFKAWILSLIKTRSLSDFRIKSKLLEQKHVIQWFRWILLVKIVTKGWKIPNGTHLAIRYGKCNLFKLMTSSSHRTTYRKALSPTARTWTLSWIRAIRKLKESRWINILVA